MRASGSSALSAAAPKRSGSTKCTPMAPKSGPLTHGVARTQSLDSALMSLNRAVALRTLSINGDRSLPADEECCAASGDVSEGGCVAVARTGIPSVHASSDARAKRPRIEFEREGFIIAYLAVYTAMFVRGSEGNH